MFDRHFQSFLDRPLSGIGVELARMGIRANQITIVGFLLGLVAFVEIAYGFYLLGLVFIILNRIFDGIDGKVAQAEKTTSAGGFLDIVFDFIFYASIPFAFGIANPNHVFPALVLVVSFVGTGSSFLAFSSLAAKYQLRSIQYPNKSIYYLGGLTEGSETIMFFILICLIPSWFPVLSYIFAFLCLLTTIFRIWYGFKTIRIAEEHSKTEHKKQLYNDIL